MPPVSKSLTTDSALCVAAAKHVVANKQTLDPAA